MLFEERGVALWGVGIGDVVDLGRAQKVGRERGGEQFRRTRSRGEFLPGYKASELK